MAITPWRPFHDFDRFFEDDDWFLPLVPKSRPGAPAMDLYETKKEVVAEMHLPDMNADDVQIEVDGDILKVSGKTEEKKEEKEKDYWRKEIRRGSFERMARLPSTVQKDKIDATYEKGVLKIVMPKAGQTPAATKVKVKEVKK